MNKQQEIENLCASWIEVKAQERSATERRQHIEQMLVGALEFDKPEGSKTFKAQGFKATLKAGMTYSLDREAWNQIEHLIPDGMRPVRTKLEADPSGCKWLRDKEPETWAICARAITAKPQKVGVTVEAIEQSEAA